MRRLSELCFGAVFAVILVGAACVEAMSAWCIAATVAAAALLCLAGMAAERKAGEDR